jgi:hypothetical protein
MEISDDGTRDYKKDANGFEVPDYENIARARLRVDARKWYLSKLASKKFGERSAIELTGKDGGPIRVLRDLTDTERAARIQAIYASAARRRDSGADLV